MNEDNKYDALKEVFRRKLENHQVPVDSSDWKAINNRLNGKTSSAKKIIVIWSSIAASVAIILAMAFLHYDKGFDQLSGNHPFEKYLYEYSEPPNDKPALAPDSTGRETGIVVSQQPSRKRPAASSVNQINKIDYDNIEINRENNNEKTKAKDMMSFGESEKQLTAKQTDRQHHLPLTKKGHKGLLLAVSFHTNHINSNTGENTTMQSPLYESNFRSTNIYYSGDQVSSVNKALIPDNMTGEYLAPLSFGLSIRKNINKHYGVETGLVYTYLSSNYRWNDSTPFDATQQLHYLGVPVNGIIYLRNNQTKWNIYLSAGVMLEKGLRMETVRKQHLPDRVVTTRQKSNIDGWQWSLNSSAGISYRFADKMKLYLEPRLGYYFDNDQPESIRTDRPVAVGFGAGLQYSF